MDIQLNNETKELLKKYEITNMHELEQKRLQDTRLLSLYLTLTEYAEIALS